MALIMSLLINVILTPILIWFGVKNVFLIYAFVLWCCQCYIYFKYQKPYLSKSYWMTLYLFGIAAILGSKLSVVSAVAKHPNIITLPTDVSLMISRVGSPLLFFLYVAFVGTISVLRAKERKTELFLVINALGAAALGGFAYTMLHSVVFTAQMPVIVDPLQHLSLAIICMAGYLSLMLLSLYALLGTKVAVSNHET